ncbi:hypothetical protein ACF3MZ_14655 [Paenibacillaceae bacterium WGS1546]|uniref:hypothetical protein n=1 Tax=Cohnella sp. WGS1546 TaxID=3366810 RepID=UPI00372CF4A0
MKIQLQHGLPIVSLTLSHNNRSIVLRNVLFDTGCAATVFDTDALSGIGIHIDFINGRAKRMYGVGGTSEICYEQQIPELQIEKTSLNDFPIQMSLERPPHPIKKPSSRPLPGTKKKARADRSAAIIRCTCCFKSLAPRA